MPMTTKQKGENDRHVLAVIAGRSQDPEEIAFEGISEVSSTP
jgi:hypothetical protein